MSDARASDLRALACRLPGLRDDWFRYLSDIEQLPRWAAGFCSGLELARGRWLAYTLGGDVFAEIEADERSGTIDLRWGEEGGAVRLLPLRLVALPGGQCLLSAVCHRDPGQDDLSFEREVAALFHALEGLGENGLTGIHSPCRRLAV